MIPDIEQQMNDIVDEASIKEVMPEFDEEQEWQQLSGRLKPTPKRIALRTWAYAAAVVVLVAIGGLGLYYAATENAPAIVASYQDTLPVIRGANSAPATGTPVANPTNALPAAIPGRTERRFATTEVIHNGTPCPIELRIDQVMKCPNKAHKDISASSTLGPDQSGELRYKENNNIAPNCSLTIKEIEIKSIATGEVILLTSSSTPSTVEEVYSYITGEKEGVVLAGVFDHDCNKKKNRHNLRLSNRNGNLFIE